MKGLRVKEPNLLVLGVCMAWDHDKPGRQAGAVGEHLSGRGQAREHQKSGLPGECGEWGHVEDVVVFKEEEIMGPSM